MGRRVERTRAGGTWTESRYFSFIRSALRRASTRYPVKFQVKEKAKRLKPKSKKGRHTYEYKCAKCKKWFIEKEISVDHITPAGSLKSYEDLPRFTELLFCEEDNLQVLCNPCHDKKTAKEKASAT